MSCSKMQSLADLVRHKAQYKSDDFAGGHFTGPQQSPAGARLVQVQADIVRAAPLMGDQFVRLATSHPLPHDNIAAPIRSAGKAAFQQRQKRGQERVGCRHGFPIFGSVPALIRATFEP